MWYVMQVVGGKEHKVLRQVEKLVDEGTYVKCFTPSYELKNAIAANGSCTVKCCFRAMRS